MHWLVAAAQRAQIAGAAQLQVARGATLNDAWDSVARALGLSSRELAQRIAPGMRLAVADLEAGEPRALKLIPEKIARKHHVYPLREDDRTIVVATADPTDLGTEQALEFAAGRRVTFQLAPPGAIAEAINAGYSPDRAVERLLTTVDAEIADAVRVVDEMEPETVAVEEVDAAPVVKLSNLILREGVASGASDIHIEPGPKGGVVRFRVDGVMRVYMHLPAAALNRVVSRIKVLGKLDIADRLRPQDGRARIELDGGKFDLRISTVPTRDAEKAVIRILRPDTTRQLDDCRLAQRELVRIRQLLTYRDGIVIVTGPTGSGKTTTL
ncbi:MAG TPA: ATPase, T2SS/T4P/T4SS family, partial [Gemmatimonadaceae bacterium]|nr:ATPase, T2SS/T4P/T4SS family [Gemmatimonadaceae bacterium]